MSRRLTAILIAGLSLLLAALVQRATLDPARPPTPCAGAPPSAAHRIERAREDDVGALPAEEAPLPPPMPLGELRPRWAVPVAGDGVSNAPAACAGGRVYARVGDRLTEIEVATGEVRRILHRWDAPRSIVTAGRFLYAFDPELSTIFLQDLEGDVPCRLGMPFQPGCWLFSDPVASGEHLVVTVGVPGQNFLCVVGPDLDAPAPMLIERAAKPIEPASSVVVHGRSAYVVCHSGAVVGVDLTELRPLWQVAFPHGPNTRSPSQVRVWRPLPAIRSRDLLVLAPNGGAEIVALDAATGSERWRQPSRQGRTSILLGTAGDLVFTLEEGVTARRRRDGLVAWAQSVPSVVGRPAFDGRDLFVPIDADGQPAVLRLERDTGRPRGRTSSPIPVGDLSISGGLLVSFGPDAIVAFSAGTGAVAEDGHVLLERGRGSFEEVLAEVPSPDPRDHERLRQELLDEPLSPPHPRPDARPEAIRPARDPYSLAVDRARVTGRSEDWDRALELATTAEQRLPIEIRRIEKRMLAAGAEETFDAFGRYLEEFARSDPGLADACRREIARSLEGPPWHDLEAFLTRCEADAVTIGLRRETLRKLRVAPSEGFGPWTRWTLAHWLIEEGFPREAIPHLRVLADIEAPRDLAGDALLLLADVVAGNEDD